jgi:hypothetical protein
MKIYMSKYRDHWLSPYTILEKVIFWREFDYDEPIIKRLVRILDPFSTALLKFLDFVHPRIEYVKIDYWDTWNMDGTLSTIILPMLKQLQKTKHGYFLVDDEDVPEELRSTNAPPKENEWDLDNLAEKRADWVMEELIWTFEQLHPSNDWEKQYHSGNWDMEAVPCEWDENGKPKLYKYEETDKHTAQFDSEGHQKHSKRIDNGLILFGKYYRGLWD